MYTVFQGYELSNFSNDLRSTVFNKFKAYISRKAAMHVNRSVKNCSISILYVNFEIELLTI